MENSFAALCLVVSEHFTLSKVNWLKSSSGPCELYHASTIPLSTSLTKMVFPRPAGVKKQSAKGRLS